MYYTSYTIIIAFNVELSRYILMELYQKPLPAINPMSSVCSDTAIKSIDFQLIALLQSSAAS